jgi:hypothetical protein
METINKNYFIGIQFLHKETALQWIPLHSGREENDFLAKNGILISQLNNTTKGKGKVVHVLN